MRTRRGLGDQESDSDSSTMEFLRAPVGRLRVLRVEAFPQIVFRAPAAGSFGRAVGFQRVPRRRFDHPNAGPHSAVGRDRCPFGGDPAAGFGNWRCFS